MFRLTRRWNSFSTLETCSCPTLLAFFCGRRVRVTHACASCPELRSFCICTSKPNAGGSVYFLSYPVHRRVALLIFHAVQVVTVLSEEDATEIEAIRTRLFRLCSMTEELESKPRILVDAEHSRLQPFIRRVTIEAMKHFNTKGRHLVYNTYQAYLK